jgi:alternative ribosome-rescue factor
MSKNKQGQVLQNTLATDLGRGKIKDNFFAALVTSKVYKLQVVQAKNVVTNIKVENLI